MRTGLVRLVFFWLFVLFVLDCIIIWWPASARARVCRVWGEDRCRHGMVGFCRGRGPCSHRDRRLTVVVLFVLPNTRGSGSAVRTKREADGGMRAVAVVGSKGKVGSRRWLLWNGHAALVIGSTRDERLRRPCMVWGRGTADGEAEERRRRAPVGLSRGPFG